MLGHLHRGFALGEYLIKFLTAEQLEGEGYVALVIGELYACEDAEESPSCKRAGALRLTKKSLRVTTVAVAWPTSVCTVTPRAVSRHSLALLGR